MFCDCGQMSVSRSSTASSWRELRLTRAADLAMPANHHSSSAAGPGQEELYRNEDGHISASGTLNAKGDRPRTPEASAPEPLFRAASPQMRSPLITFPSVDSTPVIHQPLLSASGADYTTSASGEGADGSEGLKCDTSAPTAEGHDDENEVCTHTDVVGLAGLDVTPVIAAEGVTDRVGDEARLPSELVHPGTHTPGFPYDLDTEAGQVGMQSDFSIPMVDGNEDKSEPSFGVLSNTTFDPLLAYQPHSYSHGLNIEQDDSIVEDIKPEFVADSTMEYAGMEWKADASVTTETPQPFSWIPTSVSGAFHTIFPDVQSTRMTAFVNTAMHVLEPPMLSEPYAMGATISEGARFNQVAPPQDIPCHFVSDGTHPLSLVQGEIFKGPEYIVSSLPTIPASHIPASQTTSHSSFPPTSPPMSRGGPIPISPSTRGHIGTHEGRVMDLDEEMGPKLGVAAGVQHEAPPSRSVLILWSM
jgi:hypothetical protein